MWESNPNFKLQLTANDDIAAFAKFQLESDHERAVAVVGDDAGQPDNRLNTGYGSKSDELKQLVPTQSTGPRRPTRAPHLSGRLWGKH